MGKPHFLSDTCGTTQAHTFSVCTLLVQPLSIENSGCGEGVHGCVLTEPLPPSPGESFQRGSGLCGRKAWEDSCPAWINIVWIFMINCFLTLCLKKGSLVISSPNYLANLMKGHQTFKKTKSAMWAPRCLIYATWLLWAVNVSYNNFSCLKIHKWSNMDLAFWKSAVYEHSFEFNSQKRCII